MRTDVEDAASAALGPPGSWFENSIGIRIRSRSSDADHEEMLKRVKNRYGRCPIVSKLRLALNGSSSEGSR